MTAPVKNNQVPQNDPYADPYADEGYSDPYGDYYGDEGMAVEGEDEFVGGEEGAESAPLTIDYARQAVRDLEDMLKLNEDLSSEDIKDIKAQLSVLKGKINAAAGMSPAAQEKILGSINEKLFELENTILGNGEGGDGSMKSQIEKTKEKAAEYKAQGLIGQTAYDKIMDDLNKAEALLDIEGESEEGSPQIQELIDSAQESLVTGTSTAEGAQSLEQYGDPEEIQEIAEKHGLDLDNMPNPPTKEVFDFLMEINPELASLQQGIADGFTKLGTDRDAALAACNAQNAANTACTSDNDNTDMTNFQKAYDIKAHEDATSKDIASKMKEFSDKVVAMLGAIPTYDKVEITASGSTDWASADKITIGGTQIDLINNSNGGLLVGSADADDTFNIPTIQWDYGGDGNWDNHGGVPSVNGHGETVNYNEYDDA